MEETKKEMMKNALFASAVVAVAVNAKTTTVHAEDGNTNAGTETTAPAVDNGQTESSASPSASPTSTPETTTGTTDNQNTEIHESVKAKVISDTVTPSPSYDSDTSGDTGPQTVTAHEVYEGGHWKYLKADGTYATGITNIGYKTVAYDSNGNMLYGEQKINGYWYYFNNSNGSMSTGVTDIGYKTVYYNDQGQMLFGFQNINGKTYYLDPNNGTMAFGEKKINGHWYNFDKTTGVMSVGITDLGYKHVLYDSEGHMLFGRNTYNGNTYYTLPGTGDITYGWHYIPGEKVTIYSNEEGVLQTGYQKIGNTEYYFDESTGAVYTGWKNIDGKWMYFYGTSGKLPRSGAQKIDGHWYYLNEDGSYLTGLRKVGDKYYVFDQNGEKLFGKQTVLGSDGKQKTIYLFGETGEMVTSDWIEADNGETYYADSEGNLVTGEQKIGGGTYYFDPITYAAQYGWLASQNAAYSKDGQKLVNLSGVQKIDDKTYYFDETTHTPVTGVHTSTDGNTYYLNENGLMQFGERNLVSPEDGQNHWYYFDNDTGAMATGITNIGYKTVYYNDKGEMEFGEKKLDGNWYYFNDADGTMVTGLYTIQYDNGYSKRVIYNTNGQMIFHNTIYNGKYYHINSGNGAITSESLMAYGIDISEHNGNIDLNPYKNGFVIIRAGWSDVEDKQFENNIRKCEQLGISYGIYWYGYALNRNDAASEARTAVSVLSKVHAHPTLGVWYDMEDADGWKERHGMEFSQNNISWQVNTFCTTLQNAGYRAGVYASESWFTNGWISVSYPKWVANWGNNDGNLHEPERISGISNTYVHQYTSHGGLDRDVIYDTALFA